MKTNKIKGIISTTLILSGLLSISTGAILYFVKYGMWLCFSRKFINDTHVISGLIMCMAMIIHFTLNRHTYMVEIKVLWSKKKP
ncbi:MAG: DUF4405 domain-containing protein [Syntrophomonas sp.]